MLASATILTAALVLGTPAANAPAQGCQARRVAESGQMNNTGDKAGAEMKALDGSKTSPSDKLIKFDEKNSPQFKNFAPFIFNPCCPEIASCCPKK